MKVTNDIEQRIAAMSRDDLEDALWALVWVLNQPGHTRINDAKIRCILTDWGLGPTIERETSPDDA